MLFILRQNLTKCILKLNIIIFDYMMHLLKIIFQINKKDAKHEQTKVF